jgi:hypothetical protein
LVKQLTGEQRAESVLDDYQSIDLDINTLISKFVIPIDRLRSHNSPNVSGELNQSHLSSSSNLQESRAHAFYRMLGLPSITPTGKFFNPGFNPLKSSTDLQSQEDINKQIPTNVKFAIDSRESDSRARYNFFSVINTNSSVYSLALATPKGQRPFMSMDENIDALTNVDLQNSKIPIRRTFISTRYKKTDGSEINNTFDTVSHKLRPFMTDPVISANLDPKSGSASIMVGVPFLDKKDTEFERNKYVKRPGLEFILRLRLKQQMQSEQSGAVDNINLSMFELDVSNKNQREIAATLTNAGVNEADVNQVLKGTSLLELYTLNDLVKTYKGLVSLYIKNVEIIERVYKQIIWIPLSNEGGPEKGTEVSTGFVIPKTFLDSWEIERRILQLETKSAAAKAQVDIGDDLLYGDFTISEFQNLTNVFNDRLQEARNERDRLETDASNALRTIEYISGEVSGLGLIDILAIYMAMWSIDISVLLDLIDDPAAKRLNNIKELQTQAVKNRASKSGNALEAYKKLEQRIISILLYGDRLYQRALGSPIEEEGGDIIRDQNTTF